MKDYGWKNETEMQELRENIKQYLLKHGLSYKKMAKLINVSNPTLIKFMNNEGMGRPLTIFKIMGWVEEQKKTK